MLQAIDNKVFSSPTGIKLKEITNRTEKPKRMGVLMRTRPKNFFFTLVLLFGVMTVDRSWAQDPVVVDHAEAASRQATGDFTSNITADIAIMTLREPEVRSETPVEKSNVDSLTAQISGHDETRVNCPGIPPIADFQSHVDVSCPLQNSNSDQYCACLKNLFASNRVLQEAVPERIEYLTRLGYQLQLEEWMDVYGGNLLMFANFKNKDRGSEVTLSDRPQECHPASIFAHLRESMSATSCQGNAEAFENAVDHIFNHPNKKLFRQNRSPEELEEFVRLAEEQDRFYAHPSGNRARDPNTFRDCMEPTEKRAYALLPIDIPLELPFDRSNRDMTDAQRLEAETRIMREGAQGRRTYLNNVSTSLLSLQSSSDVKATMEREQTLSHLRPLLEVFPGMSELLTEVQLTDSEVRELIGKLKEFVDDLGDPVFQNLTREDTAQIAAERMKRNVESVTKLVRKKLEKSNAANNAVVRLAATRCEELKAELVDLACRPPTFVRNPRFTLLAFLDAQARRTRGSESRVQFGHCFGEELSIADTQSCLITRRAQCEGGSIGNGATPWTNPPDSGLLSSLSGLRKDNIAPFSDQYRRMADIKLSEQGVAHMMCKKYNTYLRDVACPDEGEGYRFCVATQRIEDYHTYIVNSNMPDGYAMAIRDNGFGVVTPRPVSLRQNRPPGSGSRRSAREEFLDGLAQKSDGAGVAVEGASSTNQSIGAAISDATNVFRKPITNPPQFSVNPIEIDEPQAAAAEVRESSGGTGRNVGADIASVSEKIQDLSSAPQTDATRIELDALRAQMRDLQEELRASRSATAERADDSDGAVDQEADEANRNDNARVASSTARGGASRGPAGLQEGFTTGGAGSNRAPSDAVGSNEFRQASVDSTFGSTAATRGAVIRDSKGLPAVQSNDPNNRIALRVGDASYAVNDVVTLEIPSGTPATDATISALILGAKDRIVLDAEKRAMVEIWDENSKSSRVVYVRINGLQVEFLELNEETVMPQVRSTLADLQSRLSAGRGAAGDLAN